MQNQSELQAMPTTVNPLSGNWRFAIDPKGVGEKEGWAAPGLDDTNWVAVEIPHTWNVMADHVDYQGIAWYRRSFATPDSAREKLVRLRFEAVYYQARVWMNGVFLGTHEGGYTPFEFDVSAHLLHETENVLVVQVDNESRTDRIPTSPLGWYNYGGILRDVSLEVTSRAYVRRQRVVAVPHLVGQDEADEATITATTWVCNTASETLQGKLIVDVFDDASGESVLDKGPQRTLVLAPGQEVDVEWTVTIVSPRLWHFDRPNLYRWSTALLGADGTTLHTDEVVFGIRSAELRDGRFYLNDEPMRLVGFTRHADSPEHGPAEPIEVMKADYDDMKRLNAVFARPVHYPQHPFILDYCDRNGILVIPEVPAWQLRADQMADAQMRELERQQLREMVESEWNHPSVWAWSVANEIASDTPEGRAFVRDMAAYVHEIDPTRPVSFASHRLGSSPWRDACADFLLMNEYFGMWHGPRNALGPVLDVVQATWPDKVLFISEWGAPRSIAIL
jgi:beta-galactosidase/beta-glucuronidase